MIEDKIIKVDGKEIIVTIVSTSNKSLYYFEHINNVVEIEPCEIGVGVISISNVKSLGGDVVCFENKIDLINELKESKYELSQKVKDWNDATTNIEFFKSKSYLNI